MPAVHHPLRCGPASLPALLVADRTGAARTGTRTGAGTGARTGTAA
jgi:hypothetical protein